MNTQLFFILDGKMPEVFSAKDFYVGNTSHIYQAPHWVKLIDEHPVQDFAGLRAYCLDTVLITLSPRSESKSLRTKISKMKPGQHAKMFTSSSTSHLIAYRLTQDDIDFLNQADTLKKELTVLNELIESKIPPELLKEKKKLEKQLQKLKK